MGALLFPASFGQGRAHGMELFNRRCTGQSGTADSEASAAQYPRMCSSPRLELYTPQIRQFLPGCRPKSLRVFLRTLPGRTIIRELPPLADLEALKRSIRDREDVPEQGQCLSVGGRPLVPGQALRELGIGNLSTAVELRLALLGAGTEHSRKVGPRSRCWAWAAQPPPNLAHVYGPGPALLSRLIVDTGPQACGGGVNIYAHRGCI